MLAPSDQTISWLADERNASLDQPLEIAWVELVLPEYDTWSPRPHLPRSGPDARITLSAKELSNPGSKLYRIRDCHRPVGSAQKFCSNPTTIGFTTGSDEFLEPSPLYTHSWEDLHVSFSTNSGDVRRLSSPTLIPPQNGREFLETRESSISIDADLLTPGLHTLQLVSCFRDTEHCSPPDELQVLIGSAVRWNLGRDYTNDFLPGVAHALLGIGQPLDVTYDASGGIWTIGEFSTSIEYVSPAGTVESFTVPLARTKQSEGSALAAVQPFHWAKMGSTSVTTLAERAFLGESKLWFTQGGSMVGSEEVGNHSRIVSFDPSLNDTPETRYDDRICVYNVPAGDAKGLGNNQVIGLTAAAGRIWIGEARGIFTQRPSAISSFIANPAYCENLLDFSDPQALANQRLQYCGPDENPEQFGCIEEFIVEDSPSSLKVAHLATDIVDQSLWFTDMRGRYLGHLDPDGQREFEFFPLPSLSEKSYFGALPWTLRVDEDAVYFGEYFTRHLVRFDKATKSFDVIRVPTAPYQSELHSIEIDRKTDRLWFTLSNETGAPIDETVSTIGYIDLANWRAHIANPLLGESIHGVIYKGLDEIVTSGADSDNHPVFRGIALDPLTGKIALADMRRRQILELAPRDSFRPMQFE